MKEVFSAVIPHLRKINWRNDAEAFLSKTAWFIVEENGSYAELVFRKNGDVLLVQDGTIHDGRWEVVPELESLLLEVEGMRRRLFYASWGARPVLLMEEHGGKARCVLYQRDWIGDEKKIPIVFSLMTSYPQLLINDVDRLAFNKGRKIRLEDNRHLITLFEFDKSVNPRLYSSIPPNVALIDWQKARSGHYWAGDQSLVLAIENGELHRVFYPVKTIYQRETGVVLVYSSNSSRNAAPDEMLVSSYSRGKRGTVPDGRYKMGFRKWIHVKNGRVI